MTRKRLLIVAAGTILVLALIWAAWPSKKRAAIQPPTSPPAAVKTEPVAVDSQRLGGLESRIEALEQKPSPVAGGNSSAEVKWLATRLRALEKDMKKSRQPLPPAPAAAVTITESEELPPEAELEKLGRDYLKQLRREPPEKK